MRADTNLIDKQNDLLNVFLEKTDLAWVAFSISYICMIMNLKI